MVRLHAYARRRLRLGAYLDDPGDGRSFPQIPGPTLVWALVASKILRVWAHSATEHLVGEVAGALGVRGAFSDDALGYFTERLDVDRLRQALLEVLQWAKRSKVFQHTVRLGLALDGSGVGHCKNPRCTLCHPNKNAKGVITGYGHKLVGASVVSTGLCLPLDVEYYLPGEGELTAAKRLLVRLLRFCRIRFDYLVVDGLYPGAPFLHLADQLGLPVVARLTDKLPELHQAAQARFRDRPPTACYEEKRERIEVWDSEDFVAWEGLQWRRVRVLRYRQYKRDGTVCEAYWLTNFTQKQVGSLALYRICKSRWQIENRFFNEAKNLYGLEHTPHHHENSVLIDTLLTCLGICIERLYRLRHLHRGGRRPHTAAELCRLLWIALGAPVAYDTG